MISDMKFLPSGVPRAPLRTFSMSMLVALFLLLWGIYAAFLCFGLGLNQTNMNDYFAFGLWIVFDVGIIALGAGAFFTGFLAYVLGRAEARLMVYPAVVLGFICYSSAIATLMVDIGQPLRAWFTFWHANVQSMLTEVVFCLTVYLLVLAVEFLPLLLDNRQIGRWREFHLFSHNLHRFMIVFAALGAFLSFFHQGSLGGMYGVLGGRPFVFREGFMIWPWTFFLFILSAIAAGPCFTTLVVMLTEKISGRRLIPTEVKCFMGRISGFILLGYLVLKFGDTLYWMNNLLPSAGLTLAQVFPAPYGVWLCCLELGLGGVVPVVLLLWSRSRQNPWGRGIGMFLTCLGVLLNQFMVNIPALALPVLPFEKLMVYVPSWQEWGVLVGCLGYGIMVFSLAYRYLPLFPQEWALNN